MGAGEQREETEWFNCSAFGKLADTCNQYLVKGKQVYVEGRLSSRTRPRLGRPGSHIVFGDDSGQDRSSFGQPAKYAKMVIELWSFT